MAISHAQPLLLPLLVSLLFLPAALGQPRHLRPCNRSSKMLSFWLMLIFFSFLIRKANVSIFFLLLVETLNSRVVVSTVMIGPHPVKRSANSNFTIPDLQVNNSFLFFFYIVFKLTIVFLKKKKNYCFLDKRSIGMNRHRHP